MHQREFLQIKVRFRRQCKLTQAFSKVVIMRIPFMFRLVGYEVMKREVEVETVPVRQGQRPEYQEAGLLGLTGWGALRPRDCMGDGGLSAQGTSVLKQPRLCLSLRTLSLCSHGALVGKQTDRDPNRAWPPTGQTPNDEHGQLRVDRKWRSYEWRN